MSDLEVRAETFPIRGSFTISRGSRTEVEVLLVTLRRDGHLGRGECVPYARYGETMASVTAQIEANRGLLADGAGRALINETMPAGAARNALDCALIDLEAKLTGRRAWQVLGLEEPRAVTTAYTLSLGTPEAMAAAARAASERPLLKIKLGGDGDLERLAAVRQAAPDATLIVDANEAWREDQLEPYLARMAAMGVALVEQPLAAGADDALAHVNHTVPICADESSHDRGNIAELAGRYDFINIKLDKAGGLSEALAMVKIAKQHDLGVMVGCMLASSLAMAPATLLTGDAAFVDLDGPLLLAEDREPAIIFKGAKILPPQKQLWG
jgi:L-alanine-DL-glutamate epimerase-like enolase superfamily enzyme